MLKLYEGAYLTLLLLVANLANTQWCKKLREMTGNPGTWYSSESTERELSNEYQHDKVGMFFKNLCVRLLWTKKALSLEGLNSTNKQPTIAQPICNR